MRRKSYTLNFLLFQLVYKNFLYFSAKACELVATNLEEWTSGMREVRDHFESRLLELLGSERVRINAFAFDAPTGQLSNAQHANHMEEEERRLPNTSSLSLLVRAPGGKRALYLGPKILESGAPDFHVSTGAACHAHTGKCVRTAIFALKYYNI